jgi:hypothetical protein
MKNELANQLEIKAAFANAAASASGAAKAMPPANAPPALPALCWTAPAEGARFHFFVKQQKQHELL